MYFQKERNKKGINFLIPIPGAKPKDSISNQWGKPFCLALPYTLFTHPNSKKVRRKKKKEVSYGVLAQESLYVCVCYTHIHRYIHTQKYGNKQALDSRVSLQKCTHHPTHTPAASANADKLLRSLGKWAGRNRANVLY